VILSWPRPNYVNPQTRGPGLIYICIIFSALGTAIVTARLYSRLFITQAPGIDDLLIVVSLGFGIALAVLVIVGDTVYYDGHHVWDIPVDSFVGHRLNIWICLWCCVVASASVKISVLLFYRRLSVKFSKAFLVATWIGILYNILYLVGCCLAMLLMCNPLHAYWSSFDPTWAATHRYHCGSDQISLPIYSALSVLGDFYSSLLPMVLITYLDLPFKQKLALYLLFAMGFLVVAAGIVRTILLYVVVNKDYDFSWVLWETWIWSMVELYVSILAASAPALKPFFRRFFIEPVGTFGRYSQRKYGNSSRSTSRTHGHWNGKNMMGSGGSRIVSGGMLTDPPRMGMPHAEPEIISDGKDIFAQDVENGNRETRHFELRASQDGKMIPMQVWKRVDDGESEKLPQDVFASPTPTRKDGTRITTWPLPPPPAHQRGTSDGLIVWGSSHAHTQTYPRRAESASPSSSGSPQTRTSFARLQSSIYSRHPRGLSGLRLNPPRYEDSYDGLGSRSRLESLSGSDDEISNGEKPPWNDIKSSSSHRTPSDSEETLRLPRMGSRDFMSETRNENRG